MTEQFLFIGGPCEGVHNFTWVGDVPPNVIFLPPCEEYHSALLSHSQEHFFTDYCSSQVYFHKIISRAEAMKRLIELAKVGVKDTRIQDEVAYKNAYETWTRQMRDELTRKMAEQTEQQILEDAANLPTANYRRCPSCRRFISTEDFCSGCGAVQVQPDVKIATTGEDA